MSSNNVQAPHSSTCRIENYTQLNRKGTLQNQEARKISCLLVKWQWRMQKEEKQILTWLGYTIVIGALGTISRNFTQYYKQLQSPEITSLELQKNSYIRNSINTILIFNIYLGFCLKLDWSGCFRTGCFILDR